MWAADTPNISFRRLSGTVRGAAATCIASSNQIALRLLEAEGVGGVRRRVRFK